MNEFIIFTALLLGLIIASSLLVIVWLAIRVYKGVTASKFKYIE